MDFKSREILIRDIRDFLSQNRQIFLDFCVNLSKERKIYIEENDVIDSMGSAYDSFLLKEFDLKSLQDSLEKTFKSNKDFKKYIITRAFLHLIKIYNESENPKHIMHMINGVERIVKILCEEDKPKPKHAVNFATSILEGSDEFALHENIIDTFTKIRNVNMELEFLNLYKDVPVKGYGSVASIEDNHVVFEVGLMQMLAIIEEKNAFIVKNNHLKKHIKADIIEFNIANRTIKLGNFVRFGSMPASQRMHTRVHPYEQTPVRLKNKHNQSVDGMLYDISEGGMAFLSSGNLECTSGDTLEATFELLTPHTSQKIQITQNFELVIQINYKGANRYCMQIIPNEDNQYYISNFTKQREIDTIEDLKHRIDMYK